MPFVLDASCALTLVFNESSLTRIPDLHGRIVSEGIYVPPLWKWELANSLVQAARRNPDAIEHLMAQLLVFERLPIAIDDESLDEAWGSTIILSLKHGLTAYDAVYLEICMRRGLPLASFDKSLAMAARSEGVEVIGG